LLELGLILFLITTVVLLCRKCCCCVRQLPKAKRADRSAGR